MPNSLQEKIKSHEKIIGTIASIVTSIMFISLIEVMLSNLRGDSKIIVQPLATVFTGFFWSLYAYSKKDLFLLIPNMLAFFLGVATVISALV